MDCHDINIVENGIKYHKTKTKPTNQLNKELNFLDKCSNICLFSFGANLNVVLSVSFPGYFSKVVQYI
jgi:hypothetical protein